MRHSLAFLLAAPALVAQGSPIPLPVQAPSPSAAPALSYSAEDVRAFIEGDVPSLFGPKEIPTSEQPAWAISAKVEPSDSEDTSLVFTAFRDGHRELRVEKTYFSPLYDQFAEAEQRGGKAALGSTAEAAASKLLWHVWVFSSKDHPQLIRMMDEVAGFSYQGLFQRLNMNGALTYMDGTVFSFKLRTPDGSVDLENLILDRVHLHGPPRNPMDWAFQVADWANRQSRKTARVDFRSSLARMDKSLIGPRILEKASIEGDVQAIADILDAGIPVDAENESHMTALHVAVIYENPETVEYLLERGADPNHVDGGHGTPLHEVFRLGDEVLDPKFSSHRRIQKMVESLLKRGASPAIPNSEGESPASLAAAKKVHWLSELFSKSH